MLNRESLQNRAVNGLTATVDSLHSVPATPGDLKEKQTSVLDYVVRIDRFVSATAVDSSLKLIIDMAISTEQGVLLAGCLIDPQGLVSDLGLLVNGEAQIVLPLASRCAGVQFNTVLRPGFETNGPGSSHQGVRGFVTFASVLPRGRELNIALILNSGNAVLAQRKLSPYRQVDIGVLRKLWGHSGSALLAVTAKVLAGDHPFIELLREVDREVSLNGRNLGWVDGAMVVGDGCLVLHGWLASVGEQHGVLKAELVTKHRIVDIGDSLVRFLRPDTWDAVPWLRGESLGFAAVVGLAPDELDNLRLRYADSASHSEAVFPVTAVHTGLPELISFIDQRWEVSSAILTRLRSALASQAGDEWMSRLYCMRRQIIYDRCEKFRHIFDESGVGALAIDHGVALGEKGLLLYGWRHFMEGKIKALRVHTPEGESLDVTDSFFSVSRFDVVDALRGRFPDATEFSGFICYVPIETHCGACRLLEIELDNESSIWLRIPLPRRQLEGILLIEDVLRRVPSPDKLGPRLFELFDRHMGPAIESIAVYRPALSNRLDVRQFGIAPENPQISVIVPLYGRYDFIRFQLSHFSDDPEFRNIDLIYVIDDPGIIAPTQEFATIYHPVFGLPFRTVSYGSNRGFAGANNVGASIARGDSVLLLNSDVLPQQKGWVSRLQKALNELPGAGAVGPLLQFADDSIQHAGMIAKEEARLPGFILNIHPGKGQRWAGPDGSRECAMLTAACLMLRKQDYLDLGGLDEGYVIGDFEDSDLCLALRKRGHRLWLVPEVKLWHLERQSQNLENIAGYRQLLTLFNAWRYQKKIREGRIADPMQFIRLES